MEHDQERQEHNRQQRQDVQDVALGRAMKLDVDSQGGRYLVELMEAQIGTYLGDLLTRDMDSAMQAEMLAKARGIAEVLQQVGYNIRLAAGKSAKLFRQQSMGG